MARKKVPEEYTQTQAGEVTEIQSCEPHPRNLALEEGLDRVEEPREATDDEWFGVDPATLPAPEPGEDMQQAQTDGPEETTGEVLLVIEPATEPAPPVPLVEVPAPDAPAAEPEVPQIKIVVKRHKDFLIYKFTKPEIDQAAQDLAAQVQEEARINVEKAQVNSQFGARLKKCQAEIAKFSAHVRDGQEHRYIDCETRLNDPTPGRKRTIRLDTFETISQDRMTYDERQQELPFNYREE